MSSFPWLQVERKAETLLYRLETPGTGDTVQEEFEHAVAEQTFAELRREIAFLLGSAETPSFIVQAETLGRRLYHHLVPHGLRERLAQISGTILLFLSQDDFPFELFHDGTDFLGLRLAVGRRLVRRGGRDRDSRRRESGRWKALVVGSDPRGDLANAATECAAVREHLSRYLADSGDTSFLFGAQAAIDDLTRRLARGVDVLHYCGHLEHRADGTIGLLVADGTILSADEIANCLAGSPFVFLNGCAATRGMAGSAGGPSPEGLASIVEAFVRGGARSVVGTTADISDRHAALVSQEFYRLATTGLPIAESLRQARIHCRRIAPNSSAWLSFVLYGNPTEHLLPTASAEPRATSPLSWLGVWMRVEVDGGEVGASEARDDGHDTTLTAIRAIVDAVLNDTPGAEPLGYAGGRLAARLRSASAAATAALRIEHEVSLARRQTPSPGLRIALHLDEIDDVSSTLKGAALSLGAPASVVDRVLEAALPGQILLSRAVFESARLHFASDGHRALTVDPDRLQWLAHGPYFLDGIADPVDLFEVGVEGISPLRPPPDSARARRRSDSDEILGWRPGVGVSIPRRDQWILERNLGEGGFGEVWLARNRKLGDRRVFKFCLEPSRLRSFRRELTIFRLLRETLGERSDIVRLHDFEFERPPYLLESEFVSGGNLIEWIHAQGGFESIPLEARLVIVARIADALAAAHSAGVLHKDLKPSNILMRNAEDGSPRPCLSDFGIGTLTDPRRLADYEITPAGLTPPDGSEDGREGAGTRIYAPPESLMGSPHTVQGDIYALGVILFQLVVGGPARPLATGWERAVEDELLRSDIAAMVEGDPARRLGSAQEVAERLRDLPRRRLEAEERRRAEEDRARALRRQRIRRRLQVASIALLLAGALAALLYRAQRTRFSRAEYAHAILEAHQLIAKREIGAANRRLSSAPEEYRGWEWRYLESQTNRLLATVEPYRAALDADGHLAVTGADEALWPGRTVRPISVPPEYCSGWISPDGDRVVMFPRATRGMPDFELWSRRSGVRVARSPLTPAFPSRGNWRPFQNGCITGVHPIFSEDGSRFAVNGYVGLEIVNSATGSVDARSNAPAIQVAIGADGRQSTAIQEPGILAHWRAGTTQFETKPLPIYLGEFSPPSLDPVELFMRGDDVLGLLVARDDHLSALDVTSGEPLWRLSHRQLGSSALTVSDPTGSAFAATETDGTVRIVDATIGAEVGSVRAPDGTTRLLFSPDGRKILGVSWRDQIWQWTIGRSKVDFVHRLHGAKVAPPYATHAVEHIEYDESGGRILAISDRIRILDGRERRPHWTIPAAIRDTTADGRLAIGSSGQSTAVVDVWTGDTIRVLGSQKGDAAALARLSATGRLLTLSEDGRFEESDPATGLVSSSFDLWTVSEGRSRARDINEAGTHAVAVIGDTLRAWKLDDHRELSSVPLDRRRATSLRLSDDGRYLLLLWLEPTLRDLERVELRETDGGRLVKEILCKGGSAPGFNRDGSRILVICWRDGASVLSTTDGSSVRELHAPLGDLEWAQFSPDGKRVVTTPFFSGEVMRWDLETADPPLILSEGGLDWKGAAFDATGERIVGARGDGAFLVWNATTGDLLLTLDEARGDDVALMTDPVFTSDGETLIAALHGTSRVWSAKTWEPLAANRERTATTPARPLEPAGENLDSPGVALRSIVQAARDKSSEGIQNRLSESCRADLAQANARDASDCWTEFFEVLAEATWSDARIAGSGKQAKARIVLQQRGEKPHRSWIRFVREQGRWVVENSAREANGQLGESCGACPFSMLPPNSSEEMLRHVDF